jgi:chorismate mutase
VTVRAIRGAVQVDANEREAILEGTAELVSAVMTRNDLVTDDVIRPASTTSRCCARPRFRWRAPCRGSFG